MSEMFRVCARVDVRAAAFLHLQSFAGGSGMLRSRWSGAATPGRLGPRSLEAAARLNVLLASPLRNRYFKALVRVVLNSSPLFLPQIHFCLHRVERKAQLAAFKYQKQI